MLQLTHTTISLLAHHAGTSGHQPSSPLSSLTSSVSMTFGQAHVQLSFEGNSLRFQVTCIINGGSRKQTQVLVFLSGF